MALKFGKDILDRMKKGAVGMDKGMPDEGMMEQGGETCTCPKCGYAGDMMEFHKGEEETPPMPPMMGKMGG